MDKENVVIRFDNVSFSYDKKVILDGASFTVRRNSKMTIMGQNGAGKSTIFKLLTGKLKPQSGQIHLDISSSVGIAEQVIPRDKLTMTIREYFADGLDEQKPNLDKMISYAFDAVNLNLPLDRNLSELSGGQRARLLLAKAIFQDPEILLLDEPTNNLDKAGIEHLTDFLVNYWKTCIVISHDADFLNSFTDGVLNLDAKSQKVEQFVGNYYDVLEQIGSHIEKQRLQNARIQKSIKDRFEKVNRLGGKSVAMRRLARKVREDIEADREDIVELRRDDKTIPDFVIPAQHVPYPLIKINEIGYLQNDEPTKKSVDIELRRDQTLLISGPNGIGKSTLLKSLIAGKGCEIPSDVRVGYYSQDFSELDMEQTAIESLRSVALELNTQNIFAAAGRFLLPGDLLNNKVGSLSEGQKGLLCYARFMLQEPGLLIMDEPTNHINFRHIPVIAKAVQEYKGGLILVSHLPDFVSQLTIDIELDLENL